MCSRVRRVSSIVTISLAQYFVPEREAPEQLSERPSQFMWRIHAAQPPTFEVIPSPASSSLPGNTLHFSSVPRDLVATREASPATSTRNSIAEQEISPSPVRTFSATMSVHCELTKPAILRFLRTDMQAELSRFSGTLVRMQRTAVTPEAFDVPTGGECFCQVAVLEEAFASSSHQTRILLVFRLPFSVACFAGPFSQHTVGFPRPLRKSGGTSPNEGLFSLIKTVEKTFHRVRPRFIERPVL